MKLAAFLAVGIAITYFFFAGPLDLARAVSSLPEVQKAYTYPTSLATWIVMTTLSAFAIIMLPRQFYVTIVENRSTTELETASWLFPLYLVLINLFVIPIAFAGLGARRRQSQFRSLRARPAAACRA